MTPSIPANLVPHAVYNQVQFVEALYNICCEHSQFKLLLTIIGNHWYDSCFDTDRVVTMSTLFRYVAV